MIKKKGGNLEINLYYWGTFFLFFFYPDRKKQGRREGERERERENFFLFQMVLIFRSWPLLNTMTTYGILWTASDITQELVISRKDHVDWGKTARVATTGACVIAPLVHSWISIVEFFFPGNAVKMVVKKVLAGQLCFAPVGISSFYLGEI